MTNRYERARHISGLSQSQAAKLLGVDEAELVRAELGFATDITAEHLAKLYRVRVEWLTGESSQRDYTAIDAIKGAEKLTPHDRDVVAEFAAMLAAPTRVKPVDEVRAVFAPGLFDKRCPAGMFCHHEPTCPGALRSAARDCTCTGSCRGADRLGPGWRCALASRER